MVEWGCRRLDDNIELQRKSIEAESRMLVISSKFVERRRSFGVLGPWGPAFKHGEIV